MDVILNRHFQKSLEDNLENMPLKVKRDFSFIRRNIPGENIFILGGFVRDSISKFLYSYNFPINDLDLLIANSKIHSILDKFPKENLSRFGGLKLKYPGFSMDVFSIENIFFLKDNPALENTVENVLKGCDLTTSALGYNLKSKEIYSVGAIEDIYGRRINVNNHSYLEAAPTISRLILHADKLDFKVEKSGIDYLRKNYSPELDKKIMDFLNYKEVGHLFPLIKKNIELMNSV